MEEILNMMKAFNEMDILEMDLEKEGLKINLRKKEPPYISPNRYLSMAPQTFTMESNIPAAQPLIRETEATEDAIMSQNENKVHTEMVKSTVVGSFSLGKGIEVGKMIKKGDVLAKIESLSLSNDVLSPVNGEIVKILTETNNLIEYGEELFEIKI